MPPRARRVEHEGMAGSTQSERAIGAFKQPVLPLKKGHIAMLMASGMMGTLRLNDDDARPCW